MNRTKKKVHQKIEITFNFTQEIPLKMNRTEKKVAKKLRNSFTIFRENKKKLKSPSILQKKSLKKWIGPTKKVITTKVYWETFYFWDHFSKSHRSSVILKIFSATPNLSQI